MIKRNTCRNKYGALVYAEKEALASRYGPDIAPIHEKPRKALFNIHVRMSYFRAHDAVCAKQSYYC